MALAKSALSMLLPTMTRAHSKLISKPIELKAAPRRDF